MKTSTYIKMLAAALLSVVLVSCGSAEEKPQQTEETRQIENAAYTLNVNGRELYPGMNMPEGLGEPTAYYEAPSCAIEGMDKNYTYGSILVITEDDGKTERINSMAILDDGAATRNGVTIGDTRDKVLSVYGTPTLDSDNMLAFTFHDAVEVKFTLRDGCVTYIVYAALG